VATLSTDRNNFLAIIIYLHCIFIDVNKPGRAEPLRAHSPSYYYSLFIFFFKHTSFPSHCSSISKTALVGQPSCCTTMLLLAWPGVQPFV